MGETVFLHLAITDWAARIPVRGFSVGTFSI
jgi:hypothetical protein